MATNSTNRFALFAQEDEQLSPKSVASPPRQHNDSHSTDDDGPWQEVKRGSGVQQWKVLTIRNENKPTPIGLRPKQVSAISSDKPEDPYENWCGVCYLKFSSKNALIAHNKQSPKHEHYCNLCKRVFKDRNGLQNHVDNSAGHEIFCNLCLSAFKDNWGLKNHFENNLMVGHEFVCVTCLLGFKTKIELDRHLQTGEKHVWCHTCHRKFRNQDERDNHWINTTKHKHCTQPGCDFDGPNLAALEKHLGEDHYQCPECKSVFISRTRLNQHAEKCEPKLLCPSCGASYADQAVLAAHRRSCFSCQECGFRTHHEGNYYIHMTKHSEAKLLCWGCNSPMRTASSLVNHLESSYCSSLPDPCQLTLCLCKWWYSTLFMDVDVHAQVRRNEVRVEEATSWMRQGVLHPFICRAEGCGKTFPYLSSLILHLESAACDWNIGHLRLDWLKAEFDRECKRKDSVVVL